MTQSQISVHQERPTSSARRTVEAGCKVLKLVSDFGLSFDIASGKVKPGNPNLIVIGRMVSAFNAHDQKGENPTDAAVKFVNSQKETYRLNPHIKVWEGHNEFNPRTIEEVSWWAAFEAARVDLLNQISLRCVIGNFSTGVPDVAWWDAFVPALVACDRGNGYVGIHEYIEGKFLDASGNIREPEGILRHEPIHARAFAPNKIKSHIIATEFGVLEYRRVYPSGREYAREMFVVDARVSATPYVDGLCVFTHGSASPAWDSFDVEGDEGYIEETTNHIQAHVNDAPVTTPPDPIPPIETPPPTLFSVGQEIAVTDRNGTKALNVRRNPTNGVIGAPIKAVASGTVGRVESLPFWATLNGNKIAWVAASFPGVIGNVSQNYLDPHSTPIPPQPTPTIVYSNDWTHGQVAIPGHDNIRVPLDADGSKFDIEYLDGTTEPRLPSPPTDPTSLDSIWLAPESTMRSGDTAKYPFTERLPDGELSLYLAPDAPIVYHIFKRYGKQWWKLSKQLELASGRYRFSVELYPDIYSGNHAWAPDPISGEYQLMFSDMSSLQVGPITTNNFGKWVALSLDITHTGGAFKHGVEFRARYGVETVGVFLRRWKVERIQ